jgi:sarcosine oxidase
VTIVEEADVIVVGGGVMGLSAAWWAATSGQRVVVLERFEQGHVRGASHGGERIFRYGYADPIYVRLAVAADEGWARLEHDAGAPLIDRFGCIDVGDLAEMTAIADACASEGVAVEWLEADAAAARWPGFRFDGPVLLQPRAGRARAAATLAALARVAEQAGATLRFECPVHEIVDAGAGGVTVAVHGSTLRAPVAVVAAGAWANDLAGHLVALPPITVTCEQVAFFGPRSAGPWPSFIERGPSTMYGLPSPDGTVKVGQHHTGPVTTGDTRSFDRDELALKRVSHWVSQWLPGLDPTVVAATTCLYASTPSEDFVIDRVGNVVVAAGFSGHGFKFAPEIGRLLASMATGAPGPGAPFSLDARRDASGPGASTHR